MHGKVKLNNKELEHLLTHGNPNKYDEIKIIFNDHTYIIMEDMNSKDYCINYEDNECEVLNQITKTYFFQNQELFVIYESLLTGEELEGNTFETIKSTIAYYYTDQEYCDYMGEKLPDDLTKQQLKEFFLNNKTNIRKAIFSGTNVKGIGESKVHINYEFYSYPFIYGVYIGEIEDYFVEKILKFLRR